MNTRPLIRSLLTSILLCALMATAQMANGWNRTDVAEAVNNTNVGEPIRETTNSAAQTTSMPEAVVIMVNGRLLAGPNTSAQQRGGRLFLPVASIARALGDIIQFGVTSRIISVRRQNGIEADFNADLNQVRENGSLTLTVSGSGDIVFTPEVQELMLPVEIVAALLDVSVRRDEGGTIAITRGQVRAEPVREGSKLAPWELFQVGYDYNYSRYSSSSNHNLTLHGNGRLADSRFDFLTNFVGSSPYYRSRKLQGGNFKVERPNGQSFVLGDFGTGNDLQFMSATVRGAWAEMPIGRVRLNAFGGRSISGVLNPTFSAGSSQAETDLPEQNQPRSAPLNFDTTVLGVYITAGSYAKVANGRDLLFSSGVEHFAARSRRGDMITGSVRFASGRSRFQADLGAGTFSGISRNNVQVKGSGAALSLSGSFQLNDQTIVQGRYTYVGPNFLSAQNGLVDPIKLAAGGVTWQPNKWLTTSLSGSTAKRFGKAGDFNQFITATANLAPRGRLPTLFFSHTQNSTPQLKNATFTLANATKQFRGWRLFVNATRIKTFGPATLNAQAGASLRINESNTLEVTQGAGSRGQVSGTAAWQLSNIFGRRLNISGGLGYMRSENSPLRTTEHVSVSARLPRASTLQFSYLQTQTGPTLLLSLRGFLFSSGRAERAINGPVAEVNSYRAVNGRVYQDVNLNGRFDPDIDQPQANVKVRVDGNRYVLTNPEGYYRIDAVQIGEHEVYLDLLSVRADLTLLDGAQQQVALASKRDSVVDFRLVRTGRISGMIWLDQNENGRFDVGEQPLVDIRMVTGSGRDTLTDSNGYFLIGDLPPGEHVILVDEKTLPDQTRSVRGSLSIKVLAGNETGEIAFPVTGLPPVVKTFPGK
jgi:hypothetical protein